MSGRNGPSGIRYVCEVCAFSDGREIVHSFPSLSGGPCKLCGVFIEIGEMTYILDSGYRVVHTQPADNPVVTRAAMDRVIRKVGWQTIEDTGHGTFAITEGTTTPGQSGLRPQCTRCGGWFTVDVETQTLGGPIFLVECDREVMAAFLPTYHQAYVHPAP